MTTLGYRSTTASASNLFCRRLVAPPVALIEMHGSVDLDNHQPAVRPPPRCVEVATPTSWFPADELLVRRRQSVSAAEPDEVDLAERLRSLGDVVHSVQQDRPMPGAACLRECGPDARRRHQALLYGRRHDSAGRSRRVETCCGHEQRLR
jgi:hypothetical protein